MKKSRLVFILIATVVQIIVEGNAMATALKNQINPLQKKSIAGNYANIHGMKMSWWRRCRRYLRTQ